VFEVGELDGHPYFSLEYVEGGSLAQQLDGGPQSPKQAAQMVETLARAMHFAHLRGIVHRDLKPANILLALPTAPTATSSAVKESAISIAPQAEPLPLNAFTPKITDFGLAKRLEGADLGHTKTGAILGTPSYISPEQASGRKEIGPATDVYALGAILYELLTGRPPFRGETSMDTMLQVMMDEPVPPTRLQPKVPLDLETICLKCLHKEAHKRYFSAEALADDLKRFIAGEPIEARPAGYWERTVKWVKRRPAAAALLAVSALAFVSILGGSLYFNARLSHDKQVIRQRGEELLLQKETAETQRQRAEDNERQAQSAQKEAEREKRLAEERLEVARRSNYAFQLVQAASLSQREPRQGLEFLDDAERCPPALRDFTWHYLRRLTQRDKGTLTDGKTAVSGLSLAADGKTLATIGGDQTVTLWDLDKKQPQRTLKTHHEGPIVAIACSPTEPVLATASFDKTVRLHNAVSGAEMGVLEGHAEGVRCLAFSPDGKLLASGSHDKNIIVWEVAERKRRGTLKGHKGSVNALAFAGDNQTLVSGGGDMMVRFWDAVSEKELSEGLPGHRDAVLGVAFAPGGRMAASASADRTIRLWVPGEKKPLETMQGHLEAVQAVAFAPGERTLASASADGTVKLWDAGSGEARTTLKGHGQSVLALAFSRDGQTLLTGGADKTIRLWEAQVHAADTLRVELATGPNQPPILAWSGDGQSLATVNPLDRVLRLTNLLTGKERVFLQNFTVRFECLALSPDGKWLAGAVDDKTIRLYDTAKGQPRGTLKGHKERITGLVFSPDSKWLASGSADRTVKLWEPTGKELASFSLQGTIRCLAFSPDSNWLAASDDRSVKLFDAAAKKPAIDLGPPSVGTRTLAFAPDGRTLAVAAGEGTLLYLWDATLKQERATLKGHAAPVRALAFSADSKVLASGHADWNVQLWDGWMGQERATLTGHAAPLQSLSFTTDGQALLSVSNDGVVLRWLGGK
ncbi:MAG: protein kinase, partial [Planctomycetia bacterium]|nr:protein kinase [Planctomycetia bacterium]